MAWKDAFRVPYPRHAELFFILGGVNVCAMLEIVNKQDSYYKIASRSVSLSLLALGVYSSTHVAQFQTSSNIIWMEFSIQHSFVSSKRTKKTLCNFAGDSKSSANRF
jgi:hypothetical protein